MTATSRSFLACLFFAAVMAGCGAISTTGGPNSKEQAAVQSNKMAIVLFRITTKQSKAVDKSGKPILIFVEENDIDVQALEISKSGEGPVSFDDASLSDARKLTLKRWPSAEARKGGWRYLLLEPGNYRLVLGYDRSGYGPIFKRGFWRNADGSDTDPSLWLKVPRGRPLIYAGSFHLRCSAYWGGTLESGCSGDVAVTDERKAAQAVARASFAKIGPQHTELMKPYGIPIERRILQSFKTIALSAASHENLGTPNWKERARIWHIGGVNEASKNIQGHVQVQG